LEKRIVSYGKFRVLFNQYGEVEKLEFRKRIFEGEGDIVPIPLYMLRRVKLLEIPEGVYIQPVLEIRDNVIYSLKYGKLFSYDVMLGRGLCIVEVMSRRKYWRKCLSFDLYIEAFNDAISKLERQGFITRHTFLSLNNLENEDFKIEEFYWDEDFYNVSFEYVLPIDTTILKAVKFARNFIKTIEAYVEHRAYEKANFPTREKSSFDKIMLVKIDNLFRKI